jgi:hypothetical protein
MKQKLFISLALIFLVLLLAGLNAATYVQKEKIADTEFAPNRSTYNSGSTGAQGFFTLLSETGRNVTRWQTSLENLDFKSSTGPKVFVIIGPLRRQPKQDEKTRLMEWVAAGGTLILDRPRAFCGALGNDIAVEYFCHAGSHPGALRRGRFRLKTDDG